jgi:SAM-dependent methyltransferase
MTTSSLFERFYFSRAEYVSGTVRFHDLIREHSRPKSNILEIGCGPSNETSRFLSSLGPLTGLDIERVENDAVSAFETFDGRAFPFAANSFDLCVSNYVLEHVGDPEIHFREVFRVLRPGGFYLFRTPNTWHYVTLASRMLPHWVHLKAANKLRNIEGGHDPYPTVYRANSCSAVKRLCRQSGLRPLRLDMIEAEPSYGAAHPLLFYPMMGYERLVNRFETLSQFRVNIFGALTKPGE